MDVDEVCGGFETSEFGIDGRGSCEDAHRMERRTSCREAGRVRTANMTVDPYFGVKRIFDLDLFGNRKVWHVYTKI